MFLWPWFALLFICALFYLMWVAAHAPPLSIEPYFRAKISLLIDDVRRDEERHAAHYEKVIAYLRRDDVMKQALDMLYAIKPKTPYIHTWEYSWRWEADDKIFFLQVAVPSEKGGTYRLEFFPIITHDCAHPGVTLEKIL